MMAVNPLANLGLNNFSTLTDRQTDRQTDKQTDRQRFG